ncbi:MAG TPA: hypothetical protein VFB25_10065 [Gaiellaceae bacterium]|nr:hypothetical protein [Gaiellaceae bacterium]
MSQGGTLAQGVVRPVGVPRRAAGVLAFLGENGLIVAFIAAWTAVLAAVLPNLFVSDTWLALVDGRLIAHSGIPHHDTLTYWTLGKHWVDQQWLAQLALYELARRGGLALVAALALLSVTATLAIAAGAARILGASARSTALVALLVIPGAPWLAQLRTQTFALPLYVIVFALLALDARAPGRRVLFVLPVLAVWANLHGSVSLAAGMTALYGLTLLAKRELRGLALVAAPLTLLASPYGLGLVGYYRLMLLHPPFAKVVTEWQPMKVEGATAVFFVLAFVFAVLWGRHRRVLTSFEQWALPILLVAGLIAVRNALWLELGLAIAGPRLIDAAWRPVEATAAVRRVNVALSTFAVLAAAVVVGGHLARPASWFEAQGSPAAAAAVARAAGAHGVVLADDGHADWLLWEQPQLAGRVAYDVRFELFDAAQMRRLVQLHDVRAGAWRTCGSTMAVVTYGTASLRRLLLSEHVLAAGARQIVRSKDFGAFAQRTKGAPCSL